MSKVKSNFKLSAMALSMLLALSACNDGDDGIDGVQGQIGADGTNGIDGTDGVDGTAGVDGASGDRGIMQPSGLVRLATVPTGAEVTGAFVTNSGDLFFNFQHPDEVNDEQDADGKMHNRGGVGVVQGVNVNRLPRNAISTPIPVSDAEKETVQVAYGEYKLLGQYGDDFGGQLGRTLVWASKIGAGNRLARVVGVGVIYFCWRYGVNISTNEPKVIATLYPCR